MYSGKYIFRKFILANSDIYFQLAVTAMGEGGHNYHHTFPQDYRTSEYVLHFNVTKLFIDILFFLGLAYDMKVVPQEVIFDVKIITS